MRHDVPHQLMPISHNQEKTEMDATTVAVDLAKSVFELAIANARWRVWSRRGRRDRGASSRTGHTGTLRPGAAGDGRQAAGSGRFRWRDPSTAAAHPAGRSGGASRQRSLPRTTTPSHRRGERGSGYRPASSQRGTSSSTWDGPSTSFLYVWLLPKGTRSAPPAGSSCNNAACSAVAVRAFRPRPCTQTLPRVLMPTCRSG